VLEPGIIGHPEPEKNRQPGRMNMADIPAGMVSGGPLLRSGRLLPRPCCILVRATVGSASTESVSQLRPRKLGPPMAKTDALSKILPGAHGSAPSPARYSFHPPTSVLEASLEPMKSIYRMLDDAEEDPRVFSCSYHIGYIRHDDDKLGAAVVVVPNMPADRDYCEEVADRISRYAWNHRTQFQFSGNFGETADCIKDAVAFRGKTAVITNSGDNCGAGGEGRNTIVLRELLKQDLQGKSVPATGINDSAACTELIAKSEGDRVSTTLGTDEDSLSAKVPLEGTIVSIGDAVMGLGQLHEVGRCAVVHINGTTIDVLVMPKAIQYGTMEQFKTAGIDFHSYDIVVVKMGYLDTYLIPETAYHTMALTDGPTIQRSENIPFKRIRRPMWPIDDMDDLSYIERT
jgi:microcystin degradation protein MlrC